MDWFVAPGLVLEGVGFLITTASRSMMAIETCCVERVREMCARARVDISTWSALSLMWSMISLGLVCIATQRIMADARRVGALNGTVSGACGCQCRGSAGREKLIVEGKVFPRGRNLFISDYVLRVRR